MLKQLKDYINYQFSRKIHDNEKLPFLFISSYSVLLISAAHHICLLVISSIAEIPVFIYMNLTSIFIYVGLLFLLAKKKYILVNLLFSLEVMLFTFFSIWLLGALDNYMIVYLLLLLMIQAVVPYGNKRIRINMVLLIIMTITASIGVSFSDKHRILLTPQINKIFMVFNIFLFCMVTTLLINFSNSLKIYANKLSYLRISDLETKAYTDPLTQLFNRRYADIIFNNLDNNKINYIAALMDIDDFKKINDNYGHASGDAVLEFVSRFLLKNLRKADVVFRWGGEEFLILLADVNLSAAYVILEKLRVKLSVSDIPVIKGTLRLTVTIGTAELNPRYPFKSIDDCDKKLYRGKSLNKNVVVI
ncbi:MAG: GGDEF domain-containing protein [Syntrophomonadaceae bacterium]|nr:GGDEF domain-containing protein [Syntrophomonadaceae bacterium]